MKVFSNYSEYLHEKKHYDSWKNNRNISEAKRLAYIKQNNIPKEQVNSDIRRAETVLNSIDVMDEFSQARAEDMEIVTGQVKSAIAELGMYGTWGVAALLMLSKSVKNNFVDVFKRKMYSKIPKLIIPVILMLTPITGSVILGSVWGAGKETKASRLGRAEAINKTLNSPNQFAELTDEQEKEVEKIASGINLPPDVAKHEQKSTRGFGIIKSIKTLFVTNDDEQRTVDYVNNRIEIDKNYFDKIDLTEKEIYEAKRDKQLIQNIVEKIDIASQDYAEDVELATNLVTTVAFAGGALTGVVTNFILKSIPKLANVSKQVGGIVGIALPLVAAIYGAKIQKQASRVGRYKVKQDFLKNPEKLIYVDDEKIKNTDGISELDINKKPGFFKFIINVFKDNKEYNRYLETEYVEAKKRSMAKEQIQLTPEQKERAIQLQTNVFKMFNKLDEKSQNFSESTEAIGEMTSVLLTSLISAIGAGITALEFSKNKAKTNPNSLKNILLVYGPVAAAVLIASVLDIIITKEQKRASKVANMLAIDDLNDYRNFVDYQKLAKQQNSLQKESA